MPGDEFMQGHRSPFHDFLRLESRRTGEDSVEVRVPFREEFIRQAGHDMLHGGVISALADIAGDYAVAAVLGDGVPTIDLRVDYLRPAMRSDLVARARAVKVGRTVAVADIEVHDESGRLVAVARGAYSTRAG